MRRADHPPQPTERALVASLAARFVSYPTWIRLPRAQPAELPILSQFPFNVPLNDPTSRRHNFSANVRNGWKADVRKSLRPAALLMLVGTPLFPAGAREQPSRTRAKCCEEHRLFLDQPSP
jgi:hypothetical protein